MPDKAKINKFLTEYFGKCWHDIILVRGLWTCTICGKDDMNIFSYMEYNFFTPDGFFELIKLMKEKDIWGNFLASCVGGTPSLQTASYYFVLIDTLLNPDTFAPAVAKFLGMEEGE